MDDERFWHGLASNHFFVGGLIVFIISFASGMGDRENRSDWQQMFARSAGPANLSERNQQMMADLMQADALAFKLMPAV